METGNVAVSSLLYKSYHCLSCIAGQQMTGPRLVITACNIVAAVLGYTSN